MLWVNIFLHVYLWVRKSRYIITGLFWNAAFWTEFRYVLKEEPRLESTQTLPADANIPSNKYLSINYK